ncbi:type II secretion system F family protein [Paludibaculum fermentans]|uniref:Type II secretion system F family protein n=1 Tax=Paludibaculum fermentans TaxID=1473598 RepID=A0A7S7NUI4_PALFE|nr:type II secretion system F family protein [Paludibaculum fermentans]QOY89974.1 type II secretion system F family protein [Paludibaculum fermentans]
MAMILSFVVFLAVAIGIALLGMKLWLRPKEAIERVTGGGINSEEEIPTHPSLVFRDMLNRLGTVLPASPKDVSVMQRRLMRAGMRGPNSLRMLYGAKVVLGVALPLIMTAVVWNSSAEGFNKGAAVLAAAGLGFFGPNEYVSLMSRRRQKEIRRGLANSLDLMVVCVESGLGLDQAILQVAKELEHAHPEISEEFAMVNLELKAGKRRPEALRNLAERTAVDDLKKLVAVLIQADRFGTGVAQSLRAHSDFMRVQARQIAEEKAAKLGVKLVFPIFFCILPSLFVVTVGPVAVKIMRELIPMMTGV